MSTWRDIAKLSIAGDEGSGPVRNDRSFVYKDSEGILTIGIGRNLEAEGLSAKEVAFMFDNDIDDVERECRETIKSWDSLSDVRKAVMANMCFNLGEGGLAQFKHLLMALDFQEWKAASAEILNSRAARQLPKRYARLSFMMEHDTQWTGPV